MAMALQRTQAKEPGKGREGKGKEGQGRAGQGRAGQEGWHEGKLNDGLPGPSPNKLSLA
jgi:hypothetical protein